MRFQIHEMSFLRHEMEPHMVEISVNYYISINIHNWREIDRLIVGRIEVASNDGSDRILCYHWI